VNNKSWSVLVQCITITHRFLALKYELENSIYILRPEFFEVPICQSSYVARTQHAHTDQPHETTSIGKPAFINDDDKNQCPKTEEKREEEGKGGTRRENRTEGGHTHTHSNTQHAKIETERRNEIDIIEGMKPVNKRGVLYRRKSVLVL
jgi:hypothetical protein